MAKSDLFVGAGRFTAGTLSGLFRQAAGDDRWTPISKGLPEPASVQAVTVHPTERDVVFAGTQDGVYRSGDGGATWARTGCPRGLEVWSVTVHPRDGRVVYAGTSPVGVLRSEDGGQTWTRLPSAVQPERLKMAFACRVMRIAIVPGSPDEIYAGLEVAGAMRSLDGGEHWTDCSADLVALADKPHLKSKIQSDSFAEGMLDAHALAVSEAAPGSVFLAVRMGLFQSDDRGAHWRDMEVGRFSPLTYARDVRVSPHDPRTLYACLSPAARSEDGSLYRSTNLGKSWSRVDHGVKARATMMALALDPGDADHVACVSRCGQVFATRDGGTTWRETPLPDGVLDVYALACA
ncbi:MAG TPA: hypothetical protein VFL90_12950 [Methylomirabilota bacterium]|nr:hypothetical protein [Methylomirabilota bacterium]